jgi:hypothetical protein
MSTGLAAPALQIAEDLQRFYADPLGFVKYATASGKA